METVDVLAIAARDANIEKAGRLRSDAEPKLDDMLFIELVMVSSE
jgi:hypothetical protein